MNNYRIEPITTAQEWALAERAGAKIEFTACGDWPGAPDTYDLPTSPNKGCGGWISADDHWRDFLAKNEPKRGHLFRAIYPVRKRASLLRRLFGLKEAA